MDFLNLLVQRNIIGFCLIWITALLEESISHYRPIYGRKLLKTKPEHWLLANLPMTQIGQQKIVEVYMWVSLHLGELIGTNADQ